MAIRASSGPATRSSPSKQPVSRGSGVRGVFFDLAGTLFIYRSMSNRHQRLLARATRQMGLRVPPDKIIAAHQRAHGWVAPRYAEKDYYLHADLFRDIFIQFCTEVGGEFDFDLWQSYQPDYESAVIADLSLRDDCRSTLKELRERGYYTSIASNIDHQMLECLVEREGLDTLFDDWTSSEEARSCKPDAQFFDCTQDKSGLDVDDILFVGDSPEHDIAGGYAAGMRTALLAEPGVSPPLQTGKPTFEPDYRISTLSELLEILA